MNLNEQIAGLLVDIADAKVALKHADEEFTSAAKWQSSRHAALSELELKLDTLRENYIEEHKKRLENYFFARNMVNKDNFDSEFGMWLQSLTFEGIRTIIEAPRPLHVSSQLADGSIWRPIHRTRTGINLDEVVRNGEAKRQHDAEEHGL